MKSACVMLSMASLARRHFSTVSHKLHGFRGGWGEEGKLLKMKYVFWFSLQILSATFVILGRTERDLSKNVHWSSCKVKKKIQILNSTKIHPVWAGMFHAGYGQTDGCTGEQTDRHTNITKLIVAFRNFPNALKIGVIQRNCAVYS